MRTVRAYRRARRGRSIAPAVLLLLVLAACGSGGGDDVPVSLPVIKAAPAFAVENSAGQLISSHGLAGKIYIASFFFSSCTGPCPIINSTANTLQAEFSDLPDFRILSFTVDPETDTPERLAKVALRYGAKKDRWHFLRTTVDSVAALASKGFLMGDSRTPAMHSTRFVLVDRAGNIRGYYDGLDRDRIDELRAAIRALAKEGRS